MTCSMIRELESIKIGSYYYANYLPEEALTKHVLEIGNVERDGRSIERYEALKNRLIQISLAVASASVLLIYSIAIPKLFVPLALAGVLSSLFVLLNPVWNRLLADLKADHLNRQLKIVRDFAIDALKQVANSYSAQINSDLTTDEFFSLTTGVLERIQNIACATCDVINNKFSIKPDSAVLGEVKRVEIIAGTVTAMKQRNVNIASHLKLQKDILSAGVPNFVDLGRGLPADRADTVARVHILTIGASLHTSLLQIAKDYVTKVTK